MRGDEDDDDFGDAKTRRNVIPWRTVEKELAARLAAKAARANGGAPPEGAADPHSGDREIRPDSDVPPAPSSGVRSSNAHIAAEPSDVEQPIEEVPQRPLTYSMYTIDQIESREVQAVRLSSLHAPPAVRWNDVVRSGLVLLRAFGAWVKTSPRPRVMDLCRVPLNAFVADLRVVLAAQPWRKVALGGAIGVGALVFLLFAVVTVAELTDDLKPTRTIAGPTHAAIADAPAEPGVASPPAEPGPVVELDDPPPVPASPAPKAAAAPPKPVAKPKGVKKPAGVSERFVP
jgi:hypothetical protein